MTEFSSTELQEALRSLASTLGKCEKALTKLQVGTSQHTLLKRRIQSFHIAIALIKQTLENLQPKQLSSQS